MCPVHLFWCASFHSLISVRFLSFFIFFSSHHGLLVIQFEKRNMKKVFCRRLIDPARYQCDAMLCESGWNLFFLRQINFNIKSGIFANFFRFWEDRFHLVDQPQSGLIFLYFFTAGSLMINHMII